MRRGPRGRGHESGRGTCRCNILDEVESLGTIRETLRSLQEPCCAYVTLVVAERLPCTVTTRSLALASFFCPSVTFAREPFSSAVMLAPLRPIIKPPADSGIRSRCHRSMVIKHRGRGVGAGAEAGARLGRGKARGIPAEPLKPIMSRLSGCSSRAPIPSVLEGESCRLPTTARVR